jgi:tRNA A37 threonylcarbamoyladenosine biosynthesis protein TsaE
VEYIANLEKTNEIAKTLALSAKRGDCFCLIGDLGAGKTEFARAFIQALCGEVKVTSPTFNIVQEYESRESRVMSREENTSHTTQTTRLYHYDLYRLKSADELQEIGFEESLANGTCLIEWPQIAKDHLPEKRVEIKIEIVDSDTRKITIS